tara:strand:+ start:35 stop:436 length:402 start_codon:yes stop_codon:yes gene_type:complete
MPKYASGKFAFRISDRSGMAFPYNEMVKEWNGSTVHTSEFEPKHPQLDPRYHPNDPQSLQNAKPQIISTTVDLGINMIARNIFGAKKQTITQFNPIPAPGAFETVIVNTMQPEQDNQEVKMNSFVGAVTVSIS